MEYEVYLLEIYWMKFLGGPVAKIPCNLGRGPGFGPHATNKDHTCYD